jgi:hypothetical protein
MAAIRPIWVVRFDPPGPDEVKAIGLFESEEGAIKFMDEYMKGKPPLSWFTLEVKPILNETRRALTRWMSQP